MKSLGEVFSDIEDRRTGNGIRHKLLDVIIIAVLSTICGGKGFMDMEIFGNAKEDWLKAFLELPNGIPSHDTFGDIFAMINPKEFHKAFNEWVNSITDVIRGQVIAIDGKTSRRTKDLSKGKAALHVVSAWASENKLVLGQLGVDSKTNEITAIPELLKALDINGCIVTIDAMGTQKDIAKAIIDGGGDYILALKENQKTLCEDVELYLKDEVLTKDKKELKEQGKYHKTVEKGHGRIEVRECYISEEIGWLSQKADWKGISGIGVIVAHRTMNDTTSVENSYFIYSMKDQKAEKILANKRAHWGVETSLHWVLDMAFRDDESRAREGNCPENLNVIKHMALNFLKQETSFKRGTPSKMTRCALDQRYLEKVVFG